MDTLILKEMETHGKQPHISFFGFSGTPKNKTLEIFGRKNEVGQFLPFDVYSMKQSISEQFTLDVLDKYTTYKRYFRLNQETSDDSEIDTPSGQTNVGQLGRYSPSHDYGEDPDHSRPF